MHKMGNKKAQKWTKDGGNQMVESLLTLFKRMKEKSRGVFRTHSNIYDGASLRKQKKKISPLMRKERKQTLLKEECFLTDLFSKTHEGKEEIQIEKKEENIRTPTAGRKNRSTMV